MIKKIALFQILLSWILIGSLLSAQKVTQIKFEGLAHLSPTTAKEIAGIRVGEEMNAGKINEVVYLFIILKKNWLLQMWISKCLDLLMRVLNFWKV